MRQASPRSTTQGTLPGAAASLDRRRALSPNATATSQHQRRQRRRLDEDGTSTNDCCTNAAECIRVLAAVQKVTECDPRPVSAPGDVDPPNEAEAKAEAERAAKAKSEAESAAKAEDERVAKAKAEAERVAKAALRQGGNSEAAATADRTHADSEDDALLAAQTCGSRWPSHKAHKSWDEAGSAIKHQAACKFYKEIDRWSNNIGFPESKAGSDETWDRTVAQQVKEGKTDAPDYLKRFLPDGCFDGPHSPNAPETNLAEFLSDTFVESRAKVNDLVATDELSAREDATHQLNSLRLTSRNANVRILHPAGQSVALMVTSTIGNTGKVAELLRKASLEVDFFNEARLFVTLQLMELNKLRFGASEALAPLVEPCSRIRHVSYYFPPVKSCFNATLRAAAKAGSVFADSIDDYNRDYSKHTRINLHWLWANNLIMNHAEVRYDYVVTLEDDMGYLPDFYLYHLSLQNMAVENAQVNAVSPIPVSARYTCESEDFVQHLQGNWAFSSSPNDHGGLGLGLADMQEIVLDGFVMPWGAGYTRRYVMSVGALYLGLEPGKYIPRQRYDVFGNKYAGKTTGRLTLTPVSSRCDGDPKQRTKVWLFNFPKFHSCNHTTFFVRNSLGTAEVLRTTGMEVYDEATRAMQMASLPNKV